VLAEVANNPPNPPAEAGETREEEEIIMEVTIAEAIEAALTDLPPYTNFTISAHLKT